MRLYLILILGFGLTATLARARVEDSRQINGGDVIYTAQATGLSERQALFQAEGQAVRMLSIECSVPPRGAKIFQQSIESIQGRFSARVQMGVALADCEMAAKMQANGATPPTNKALAALHEAYAQYLLNRTPAPAPAPTRLRAEPPAHQFTPAEIASAERAIDARVKDREEERRRALSAN